jgi:DNA-binding MarR family transcriptional regulator
MKENLENQVTLKSSQFTELLMALQQYNTGLLTASTHIAADLGRSLTETIILEHLEIEGPLTPTQLIRLTRLSSGAMTTLLDRLEARAFIRRESHPKDRRSILVHCVPQDESKVENTERLYQLLQGFENNIKTFDPIQQKTILEFLQSMQAVFKAASA